MTDRRSYLGNGWNRPGQVSAVVFSALLPDLSVAFASLPAVSATWFSWLLVLSEAQACVLETYPYSTKHTHKNWLSLLLLPLCFHPLLLAPPNSTILLFISLCNYLLHKRLFEMFLTTEMNCYCKWCVQPQLLLVFLGWLTRNVCCFQALILPFTNALLPSAQASQLKVPTDHWQMLLFCAYPAKLSLLFLLGSTRAPWYPTHKVQGLGVF